MLLEQVVCVHPADAQQLAHVLAAQSANLPAESCQRGVILPVGSAEPRWYAGEHRHQRLGEALHLRGIGLESRCVRSARVLAHPQAGTVRPQRRGRHVARRPFKPVRRKLQIAQHIGAQLMDKVRAGRDLKPRGELARERGAADLGLRLEHEYRAAAARQRRGANQAVVAGAYHDAIVARAQCSLPRSLSTARAAFAPGAPMTPPPGCVLEPHMYRPRTGARYCAKPGTGRLKSS